MQAGVILRLVDNLIAGLELRGLRVAKYRRFRRKWRAREMSAQEWRAGLVQYVIEFRSVADDSFWLELCDGEGDLSILIVEYEGPKRAYVCPNVNPSRLEMLNEIGRELAMQCVTG